jgi:hydroxymethylglutaryl-CoA lyase
VSLEDKVRLVEELAEAGLPEVEVSAFVRPDRVPQLADAAEVFAAISRRAGTLYSGLVPNERGLQRAIEAGVDKVSLFTAASETFTARNTNATIDKTIERFRPVVEQASKVNVSVRAYISCVVACPYEGPIAAEAVRDLAERLLELGPMEIDLGDTIGVATPADIEHLLEIVSPVESVDRLVLHLHDTQGEAIACAARAIDCGIRRFDSACGGLGGCPFAPGAPGNLSTMSLLELCHDRGLSTGVDIDAVRQTGQWIRRVLG